MPRRLRELSPTAKSQLRFLGSKVRAFLAKEFAAALNYQAHVLELWERYCVLGLPNDDFVAEFTSGKKPSLFQRVWEMMVARHLDAQGHKLACLGRGRDFQFEHEGVTVWVEAIAPEPRGLPDDWITGPAPGEFRVGTVPHDQVLLRWTAAFKEKWLKLQEYQKKGIVGSDDAYVIAISGVQLGRIPMDHGISRLPLAVETVFPVGPLAVIVNAETHRMEGSRVSERFLIRNANKAPVPTTPFVDPAYAGVSAVFGCSIDRCSDPNLPAYVAHNPLARVGIAPRTLGTRVEEWIAEPASTAGEFELTKRAAA
jgi:type I restriction enzyme S subunit